MEKIENNKAFLNPIKNISHSKFLIPNIKESSNDIKESSNDFSLSNEEIENLFDEFEPSQDEQHWDDHTWKSNYLSYCESNIVEINKTELNIMKKI